MSNRKQMVTITADGSNTKIMVPSVKYLRCGSPAELEMTAGYPQYRCELCGALEGSVAQPYSCRDDASWADGSDK